MTGTNLAERASGDLNTVGKMVLGMTGRLAVELTEGLQVIESKIVSGQRSSRE